MYVPERVREILAEAEIDATQVDGDSPMGAMVLETAKEYARHERNVRQAATELAVNVDRVVTGGFLHAAQGTSRKYEHALMEMDAVRPLLSLAVAQYKRSVANA